MKAEIITIGDEILIGQTVDSNSAWIGEELNKIGIDINRIVSIKDESGEIVQAINESFERVDLVLMTGGLGPTRDDITKQTLSSYFDDELVMNQEILSRIESYFVEKGLPILEMNRQQAMLPSKAKVVPNLKGSASGMWFEQEDKVLLSMPGVPYEMKHIMQNEGLNRIKHHFNTEVIYHKTILTTGAGESYIANRIKDWENELRESGLSLAYLPSLGIVKIRITGMGGEPEELEERVNRKAEELKALLPDLYFGEDKDKLEEIVGELLKTNNKKVATAESCTGGYIAHLLTSVPGSSEYYEGTYVTYSYDLKSDLLAVDKEIIRDKGAVSEEVVLQMAEGIKKNMNVDYAIAVSGIAGPGGGTPEKPVGTVWMALAGPNSLKAERYQFGRTRMNNIRITAITALNWLRKELQSVNGRAQ